jgi:hypothetical protein
MMRLAEVGMMETKQPRATYAVAEGLEGIKEMLSNILDAKPREAYFLSRHGEQQALVIVDCKGRYPKLWYNDFQHRAVTESVRTTIAECFKEKGLHQWELHDYFNLLKAEMLRAIDANRQPPIFQRKDVAGICAELEQARMNAREADAVKTHGLFGGSGSKIPQTESPAAKPSR